MANTETLQFNNDPISVLQSGLVAGSFSGTLMVTYNNDNTVASVIGSITTSPAADSALPVLTYQNFTGSYNIATGTFSLSSPDGILGLGTTTFSLSYIGQAPTTATSSLALAGIPTFGAAADPVVCFCSGTMIRTVSGDVAVENLTVGDRVVTVSDEHRPIRWLGHRLVDCRNHPRPHEVMPVRIATDAFGKNRPARDLLVSPGHSICIDVLGEVLVPAIALINGRSVQQIEVEEVAYWHVELDSHDILLAENLPAESYLSMGNRGFFSESDIVDLAGAPDADTSQRTHADFCRPFYTGGPIVEVVRSQLVKREEAAGWSRTSALELHLEVDGRRIDPMVRGLTARFEVPTGAEDVWLVSPTARPCDTMGTGDRRELGICIGALKIDDGFDVHNIQLDDPLLCVGFHEIEDGTRRWTAGRARLPASLWCDCDNGFYLRVEMVCGGIPRWKRLRDDNLDEVRPLMALVA